jgi:hypothetical protein
VAACIAQPPKVGPLPATAFAVLDRPMIPPTVIVSGVVVGAVVGALIYLVV